jgi:hypothetical protein
MMTCSEELPGPPPQSFTEFLRRITPIYSTFALDLATTWLLVFFWHKVLFSKESFQRRPEQRHFQDTLPQRILLVMLFSIPTTLSLIIDILLPASDLWYTTYGKKYPGRIWWELFYTAVLVLSLPWIFRFTIGTRRLLSNFDLNVYKNSFVIFPALGFWPTLHLFRYLLWKYSNRSSCAYERLYMISDWRNMVWFWDPFDDWDKYQ